MAVRQLRNGDNVLAAEIVGLGLGLVWLASDGSPARQKLFSYPGIAYPVDAEPTDDGGLIIAGYRDPVTLDADRSTPIGLVGWVLKLTAQGDIEWDKTYRDVGNVRFHDLVTTKDGGYALVGSIAAAAGTGGSDLWLVALDGRGELRMQKRIADGRGGATDAALALAPNGGYIVAAPIAPFGGIATSPRDLVAWVMKLDSAGRLDFAIPSASVTDTQAVATPDAAIIEDLNSIRERDSLDYGSALLIENSRQQLVSSTQSR